MQQGLLTEQCVLVTGASRGIGAAVARQIAELGGSVAIGYSASASSAQKLLETLPGSGHFTVQINVSDEASVGQAFDQVLSRWQRLDGLVNNAGITRDQLSVRMSTQDFDDVIQTNLRGTFLCTRLATKVMMRAKRGSIVNISSVIGQLGQAGQANYAASKAGIEAMSRSVAQELASRNVRVNCVAPGFIATDMTDALNESQKKSILEKIPLGRIGETQDVAHLVCFLLSSHAKYITGHTINVDGGIAMR